MANEQEQKQWLFDDSDDREIDDYARRTFRESRKHLEQYPHLETMRHFIGAVIFASGLTCNYWEENDNLYVQVNDGPTYEIAVNDVT